MTDFLLAHRSRSANQSLFFNLSDGVHAIVLRACLWLFLSCLLPIAAVHAVELSGGGGALAADVVTGAAPGVAPEAASNEVAARAKSRTVDVVLLDELKTYPATRHCKVHVDETHALSAEAVMRKIDAGDYQRSGDDSISFGFTDSVVWCAMRVTNTSSNKEFYFEVDDAFINHLKFIVYHDDGRVVEKVGGALSKVSERSLKLRSHMFKFDLMPGESASLLLRASSELALYLPLRIWSVDGYSESGNDQLVIYALYFGALGAMIFYNFIHFLILRERNYILYTFVVFFSGFFIFLLSGFGNFYIFPRWPEVTRIILPFSCGLLLLSLLHFSASFLRIYHQNRRFPFVNVLHVLTLIQIVLSCVYPRQGMIMAILLLPVAVTWLLTLSVRAAMTGNEDGRYFLVSWTLFLLCGLVVGATSFDLVPRTGFTWNAVLFGSVFESMMKAMALAAQTRSYRDYADKARRKIYLLIKNQKKELEDKLEERTQMMLQMQQKLRNSDKQAALGVFSAGMAHEINNPANFVSGGLQNAQAQLREFNAFIQELLADEGDDEIRAEFDRRFRRLSDSHGLITEGIERISHVVQRLRAAYPDEQVQKETVNVAGLLGDVWQDMRRNVSIPVQAELSLAQTALVECRVSAIRQVCGILISNALHTLEEAHGVRGEDYAPRLGLAVAVSQTDVTLTVADNGMGIPPAHLERIFEPFYTTRRVGEGAGMGLFMANEIVSLHDGKIELDSTPGQGTVVTIRLPLCQAG
jgi:signal transduction histidine kinase